MRDIHRILLLATLLALPSCAIQVDLPEQFLVTQKSATELKATTAGEEIFLVERYSLQEGGDNLAFWADALKKDLVDNRGYTLIEEAAVQSKAGVDGVQMTFEATVEGQPYCYLTTLFVEKGPRACVARFTAEKSEFARHRAAVEAAILTIRD